MTKLRPFQVEGVKEIYKFRGRALLADEQGLGKTIQALYWILKCKKRRPVVIVTPASVKYAWQAEAALHLNMRVEVISGRRKKRNMTLPGDIVIINYDILTSWMPALKKAKPEIIIFDECHYIKNTEAQRTKAGLELSENAASVVGLSGTPLTNRPIELWPILYAINPKFFPSYEKYAWRYCKPRFTSWGWFYDGASRTGELNRKLTERCMIRRLKKDVAKELPPKIRKVVPFKLSSYKEYNKARDEFLEWLKEISPSKAKRAKKSQALTKIGYLMRLTAKLKLPWTTKWIEEWIECNPGEKLIAFSGHTFVLEHLAKKFGSKAVLINGSVTGTKREASIRRFINNKKVPLLLGNWIAAGVGLNLQVANNVAGLDFPWTPGDLVQAEDRIHRIGQTKQCIIHYLIALNTIEEKKLTVLRRKSRILEAVLNGTRAGKDVDMFNELMKEMAA
jgi:SWI/SNF-related matrix-associated actin-dependent regulator 1 of chromatin subfamily A